MGGAQAPTLNVSSYSAEGTESSIEGGAGDAQIAAKPLRAKPGIMEIGIDVDPNLSHQRRPKHALSLAVCVARWRQAGGDQGETALADRFRVFKCQMRRLACQRTQVVC